MMRALTLIQPWAGLVASGIKLIENRTRSMVKRGDFGYLLRDVRALARPVPCQGARGFWTLPAAVEDAVVREMVA